MGCGVLVVRGYGLEWSEVQCIMRGALSIEEHCSNLPCLCVHAFRYFGTVAFLLFYLSRSVAPVRFSAESTSNLKTGM